MPLPPLPFPMPPPPRPQVSPRPPQMFVSHRFARMLVQARVPFQLHVIVGPTDTGAACVCMCVWRGGGEGVLVASGRAVVGGARGVAGE